MINRTQAFTKKDTLNRLDDAIEYAGIPASRALEKIVLQLSKEDLRSLLSVPDAVINRPRGFADEIVKSVSDRLHLALTHNLPGILAAEMQKILNVAMSSLDSKIENNKEDK